MATIDYKQKIKDYMNSSEVDTLYKSMLNNLFPELAESEDEMIRKDIIVLIKDWWDRVNKDNISTKEQMIAWLEKQGEHANFLNKIQIGDKVTRNEDGVLVNLSQLKRVAKKDEKQGEQKPTLEDAAKAFLEALSETPYNNTPIVEAQIITKQLLIFLSDPKSYNPDAINEYKAAEWSEEDDDNMIMIEDRLSDYFDYIREDSTLSKNQKKSLKEEIIRYVNWLKSLKDRVQPQPKQEWSEEDKNVLDDIKVAVTSYWDADTENIILNWLKSLRPQSQWKPSEEHLHWLKWAINRMPDTEKANEAEAVLEELLADLKKLNGEEI